MFTQSKALNEVYTPLDFKKSIVILACQAICCGDCSVWYHKSCLSLSNQEYEKIGASYVSWQCLHCNSINVNSFTYYSYNMPLQNSFNILQRANSSACPDTAIISPISNLNPRNASPPKTTECINPDIISSNNLGLSQISSKTAQYLKIRHSVAKVQVFVHLYQMQIIVWKGNRQI